MIHPFKTPPNNRFFFLKMESFNGIYDNEDNELERKRLIKGSETRLAEERPNLFDIFYINSGISMHLPTVCSPYTLLDPDGVVKFLGLQYPRDVTKEEIEIVIDSIDKFIESNNRYWHFCKMFLTERIDPTPEDIIEPFKEDIKEIIDMPVDELEALVLTLEKQKELDIKEHKDFYNQLYHKLRVFLSMSWLDRFHNDLLKNAIKRLVKQELKEIPEIDDSFFTKTQKKFRQRVLMQGEDGFKQYNHYAKRFFDARRKIRSENAKEHLIPQAGIEGLQYWGDEEVEFNDTIKLKVKNENGLLVLPDYEANVYLGYDWNRYNRKKFNPMNLPPKSIRGYIFRIYYPELKNRAVAPRYRLIPELIDKNEPVPDQQYKYTAIVFEAAEPYLPIGFRIVDKEWDTYRNDGVCSSFVQGVFTFQITFKAALHYKGKMKKPKQ